MAYNFRTAFGGFHKEDVVRYLEYSNTKHQNQVNQLNSEIDELRRCIASAPAAPADAALEAQCRALEEENLCLKDQKNALEQRCAELTAALEEAKNAKATAAPAQEENLELEAYRRAERIQKDARDRAELVYFQATTALAEATSRVEGASGEITAMTDQVMSQITQLQIAVSTSKQALQDAAAVMSTIRPNR